MTVPKGVERLGTAGGRQKEESGLFYLKKINNKKGGKERFQWFRESKTRGLWLLPHAAGKQKRVRKKVVRKRADQKWGSKLKKLW